MTKSQCRRILLGFIIWLIVLSPIVIALTWTIISPEQTPFVWAGINSNHSVAIKVNIAFTPPRTPKISRQKTQILKPTFLS